MSIMTGRNDEKTLDEIVDEYLKCVGDDYYELRAARFRSQGLSVSTPPRRLRAVFMDSSTDIYVWTGDAWKALHSESIDSLSKESTLTKALRRAVWLLIGCEWSDAERGRQD